MSIMLGELEISHPIMVGAGPWSRNAASIQKCIDYGASAVVTETITLDAHPTLCPHIYAQDQHIFNTKLFSDLHLEQWEREIKRIDKKESKLICSIWGSSASEVSYLASKVSQIGADGIELSLFSPIGTRNRMIVDQSEKIIEFIAAIRHAVHIPVIVKLSYEIGTDPFVTKQIYDSGIRVVSAIDGLKGLSDVNVETQSVKMPTYGGFTGDSIRPMALATTAALKQNTSLQICSVGGISHYTHVLGYLMLGADAVQLASVIQTHGFEIITKIKGELSRWLEVRHYSLEDIRGSALSSLLPFEDLKPQPLIAAISDCECLPECQKCTAACLYDAISYGASLTIEPSLCVGCGICVDLCPCHKLFLVWQ
jgi:dihydroorotate dehydrogenase/NAD-dependent dihydropyrimidine dehydrogenase PreA subunit